MDQPPEFDRSGFSLAPIGQRVEKPWGYEILLSPPDAPYTSKLIYIKAGELLSLQLHDAKVETQTLVAGQGVLLLEGRDGQIRAIPMEKNVGYHIAVGQRHRTCAGPDEDALVFESSTPEIGTTYRLADKYDRTHETEAARKAERG
jgi:hypothetical protein